MNSNFKVKKIISQSGAPLCGAISFDSISRHLIECSAKSRLPKNARSVIMAVFPYYTGENDSANIAQYARVADYHKILGDKLEKACSLLRQEFKGEKFEYFVDNSPIPEVSSAALSGLGVIGKHGLLIHPLYGSFVFIGEIVTTLPLEPTGSKIQSCEGCGACLAACPGGALDKGNKRTLCISAILQKKSDLSLEQLHLVKKGKYVFGCDLCQLACPHNKNIPVTTIPEFLNNIVHRIEKDKISTYKDRAFFWRGEKVIARNLCIMDAPNADTKKKKAARSD